MYFFTYHKKSKQIVIVLLAIVISGIMLTTSTIKAEAADFKHKHGSSCYTQGTVACSAVHTQSSVPESATAHCDNCGTSTAHTVTVRWENCQGTGEKYELGGYRNCNICGSRTYEWSRSAWNHQRTEQVLTCKKGTTATGTLWLKNTTTDWTTGNVVLEAGVKILSSELSLAGSPYSWDKKASWTKETKKEVTENGTYTVYAKSSGGTVVGESVQVVNIDRTGPGLAGVDKSTSDWTNQDVVLTFHGEDAQPEGGLGCGLATQAYSFDNGVTYSENNRLTVSGNGTFEVYLMDQLGNVGTGQVEVTNIDKNAPEIAGITSLNEGWQPESVTMRIEAADVVGGSGLHHEAYSLDSGVTWQSASEFLIGENGSYQVQVRDAVGNIATGDFLVNQIDVTAPVIEGLKVTQNKNYEDKVFVRIFAKDIQPDGSEGSGLHNEAYSIDGGETWQAEDTFWVKKGQSYDIRVRDALEWESGEYIVKRKNFPYPPLEEEKDKESGDSINPIVKPNQPEGESALESGGEKEPEANHANDPMEEKSVANEMISNGNMDGIYAYGSWYEHRDEILDITNDTGESVKEESKNVLMESQMSEKENQVKVVRLPWYTTPIGKTVVVSATTLAIGAIIGGLFWLYLFSVPIYCVEEKNRLYNLGRALLHRTKEGYCVYLSDFMLQTATVPRYRIKVSRLLLKRVENARLLVESEEKNLEVLMQESGGAHAGNYRL